ncbi:glycoside hydrolase family 3 C-terminal domain-containing protein [Mediterraneibacter glycyrrhizinilyticus]|uniref:glycoside hydrolase family 3 C-terminal domain-containing protein n=1 Tax=Mediterraneibacter glycyrrhizinilyticus TaxID=342942 RepID=UPI00265A45B1|nr:glycoside hydrolase family 3 C-terminal domain-containing protein [Mediterraneibacter glycyrrhizinilyticus]MCF2569344.1 glycoside hydrolase family 3 C-terminal domain-containing protein [Mediterraneibacter glycyrrhizinilyticus]
MERARIREFISQMTLEEKAGLCSGADFWHTKGVERLGIPSVMVSDGPHGLRKQEDASDHLGINESIRAVCFPAGCATASSFDRNLLRELGEIIGEECQAENISTILGPAMNIKRSPLCGRNFEYYSEDPLVSSEMAGALIHGVQSKNVGTSPKHFMANNQEYHRMTSSSEMDERTMREIYLAAFEGAVKKEKPWTIMNAYNKLNGTYLCENQEMLTDVLRDEWKFDGYVMTDWGAMNDRVKALKAGCNLEMPASGGVTDEEIAAAVKDGILSEKILDQRCEEYLNIIFRYEENRNRTAVFDLEKDHEAARRIEEECIVLLKNENDILPLSTERRVAFIGKYAEAPRYQGGGSSHINSFKVESALDAVRTFDYTKAEKVVYAQGYDDAEDRIDEKLLEEAVETAKNANAAVIFAGLPDSFESEGYDRKHMRMPECQNALIRAVAAIQPNTIVVLHNGAPVEMPWIHDVKAVLEAYLGGQAVGGAVVNVLYGKTNPSGHLAETFPLRVQDTPCYLNYGGEHDRSVYSEGVFVGYRYYASKEMEVLFPFGHGLSYTTFSYSNLRTDKEQIKESGLLHVSVDVTNAGKCAGKEVVQLYVAPKGSTVIRPVRELRAFGKISLEPGETKTMTFCLDRRAFAYWSMEIHNWYVESGEYELQIGKNAQDIVLSCPVYVESETVIPKEYTLNSTLGEIMADPKGKAILEQGMAEMMDMGTRQTEEQTQQGDEAISSEMMEAMMEGMPLRQMLSFVPGVTKETLNALLAALNG